MPRFPRCDEITAWAALRGRHPVRERAGRGEFASRSVAPYCRSLKRFLAYLQQLEMESNGKRVWGIDSFDQWRVELGKGLGNRLLPPLEGAGESPDAEPALDPSTLGLLARLGRTRSVPE